MKGVPVRLAVGQRDLANGTFEVARRDTLTKEIVKAGEVVDKVVSLMDEIQEKQDRVEFLGAVAGFLREAVPAAMATPQLTPLLMQLLKFAVTGFKVGKSIEGDIDAALDQFKAMAANPPPPPPDPEMVKVQGQMQLKQQELMLQEQANERQAQREMQIEAWKQQQQHNQQQAQVQMEIQRDTMLAQQEAALEKMRMQIEAQLAAAQGQIDILKQRLGDETKIEIAQISANTTLQAAQVSAAEQAVDT